MQKITFLLCVTLDRSLIQRAEGRIGGALVLTGGKGAYFPKCPLLHALLKFMAAFFAVRSIVGFSVSLQVDVCLNPGSAESWQSTLFHSFLLALILTTLVDFSFPSTSHAKAMCLQNVNSCVSDC